VLQVKDIHTYYGNIAALKGVSLRVDPGEIVALLGRNGAGKTTLLNTISGFLQPRSGEIFFAGERILGLTAHLVAAKGISQVPEGRRIFAELSVHDNLEIGGYTHWGDRKRRMQKVMEIFPKLEERQKQLGGTLSGGEQQMLAVGRGLMSDPKCLLLDEPSLGLAPLIIETLFEAFRRINESGVTILLVEQNAVLALELAKRAYVIQNGLLVSEGSAADLGSTDLIRKAYLGLRKVEAVQPTN
jgi:branched-chain amino acid transport system ATP-binding protein